MEALADFLARKLTSTLDLSEEDFTIIAYSLKYIFSFLIAFLAILIGGWIFGVLPTVLAATITIFIWKSYAGGSHCKSPRNCAILGALITTLIGLIAKYTSLYITFNIQNYVLLSGTFITFTLALWSAWKFAPADSPAKPITNPIKRKKLRKKAFVFLFIWTFLSIAFTFFDSSHKYLSLWLASNLGILWQAFSLTPTGYSFVIVYEKIFKAPLTINA